MLAPDFIYVDMYDGKGGHQEGYALLTTQGYKCQPTEHDFEVREVLVNKEQGAFGCWLHVVANLIPDSCLLLSVYDLLKAAAAERREEKESENRAIN